MHALRPQALEQDDFWQALKGIVKDSVGTTLHTTFETRGKVPVSASLAECIIGQEALTDALKYARAKHFGTRLSHAKEVRLELSDNRGWIPS